MRPVSITNARARSHATEHPATLLPTCGPSPTGGSCHQTHELQRKGTQCAIIESRPIAISTCPGCRPTCSPPKRPRELKDRMPYVTDGPDGPQWVTKNGANFGLQNGVGPGGAKLVPGQNRARRHHGQDRPVRGRQEGHPPRQRPASARQGHGPRRRRRRGDLRHPRLRLEDEGQRGGQRRCSGSTTTG